MGLGRGYRLQYHKDRHCGGGGGQGGQHHEASQVQHQGSYQDCCGASEPLRASQDVGGSEESEQELPTLTDEGNMSRMK